MLQCALWAGSAPQDRGGPVAAAAAEHRAWRPWEADNKSTPGTDTALNLHLETVVSYRLESNSSNMRKNNATQ